MICTKSMVKKRPALTYTCHTQQKNPGQTGVFSIIFYKWLFPENLLGQLISFFVGNHHHVHTTLQT